MRPLAELVTEFSLQRDELLLWVQRRWVQRRWVLPLEQDGDYMFSDIDAARVQMIVDLRHDLAIDDEAMPIVLDLLDKLHGVRRQMRGLLSAIAELPDQQREALMRRVGNDDA